MCESNISFLFLLLSCEGCGLVSSHVNLRFLTVLIRNIFQDSNCYYLMSILGFDLFSSNAYIRI